MDGKLTSVTTALPGQDSPFVVQENVTVTTAGTMAAITNTPPVPTLAGLPCGRNAQN